MRVLNICIYLTCQEIPPLSNRILGQRRRRGREQHQHMVLQRDSIGDQPSTSLTTPTLQFSPQCNIVTDIPPSVHSARFIHNVEPRNLNTDFISTIQTENLTSSPRVVPQDLSNRDTNVNSDVTSSPGVPLQDTPSEGNTIPPSIRISVLPSIRRYIL